MRDIIGREFTSGPCADCEALRSQVVSMEKWVRLRLARAKMHGSRQALLLHTIGQMQDLGLTGLSTGGDDDDVHGDSEVDDTPG